MQRRFLLAALACTIIVQSASAQTRSAGSLPSKEASAAAIEARERAAEVEHEADRAAGRTFNAMLLALPAFGLLGLVFVLINSGGNDSPG